MANEQNENNKIKLYTQRGQSRVWYIRDREVDIERAKKLGLGHMRCSKGEARGAEPMFRLWFRRNGPKEVNGEARCVKPKFGGGDFGDCRGNRRCL